MAEKMTPKGLVVGLIVDQKKGKRTSPKPKADDSKQNDTSEQAEKTEE